jgi:membrane glycosyltransferase
VNRNDNLSPTEYAELVRDARELVAAVERAVRRAGIVFVVTMGLTVAATALGLDLIASLAAVVAVIAFTAALVSLMVRIAIGPMPAEVATTTPAEALPSAANGSGGPATGSGPATATNRRILRK